MSISSFRTVFSSVHIEFLLKRRICLKSQTFAAFNWLALHMPAHLWAICVKNGWGNGNQMIRILFNSDTRQQTSTSSLNFTALCRRTHAEIWQGSQMAIIVNGLFVGLNIICLYSKTDMSAVFALSSLQTLKHFTLTTVRSNSKQIQFQKDNWY